MILNDFRKSAALSLALFLTGFTLSRAEPSITEFMASNSSSLMDEDGDSSDWIEIHNPDVTAVNLNGWFLTDTTTNKKKWAFPAVTLAPDGYLIVFASGKDRHVAGKPLHTNFSLDANGEYLALVRPDGTTAATEFNYPAQSADISFGFATVPSGASPVLGFLATATPGAPNPGPDKISLAETVQFSRTPGPFSGTFQLTLSGAGPNEHIRYVLATPSAAGPVAADPTSSTSEYTGPITISSSVVVRATIFTSSDVAHGRPASSEYITLNPAAAGFSTNLPVLVFDSNGAGPISKDGLDHPAWLYAYDPAASGQTFTTTPKVASPIVMSVHGNFTSAFPKQSYNFVLEDSVGNDNDKALLGLDKASDWAVIAPWSTDRSYIRNAFVYALSSSMGHWAPRTRFVEMFVNNNADGLDASDYWGIGFVIDRLKLSPDRIDIATLSKSDNSGNAVTGGYLFKLDPVPDPQHYNFITAHGIPAAQATAVVVETPSADSLTTAQRDYIHGEIQDMENALFADYDANFSQHTYLDYIDLPSWVDHHLLEVFVGNVDGLYRSDYFYKDRGGKIISGPVWDFDSTMGNGDPRNADTNTWQTEGGIDVWGYGWWQPLAHDPEFMQAWVDRWQALRRNEFADAKLSALADSLAAQVGTAAAARDAVRWPDNISQYPGGFLGEVGHQKDWITKRAAWIDQQWVAAPAIVPSGAALHLTAPAGAQLIYTLDGSDPRSYGGAIAPGAIVSTTAVDVPATANLHVRSYRPDLTGVFPGTPWSSAATVANSSPLLPRARLVNLSSRGLISGGENALIAGVVVGDTGGKHYLSRAVGPGLAAFGATGTLADPQLSVFNGSAVEIYRNNGWQSGTGASALPSLSKSVGAFPLATGSNDSALDTQVTRGSYTFQITSPSQQSGIGLVELYELDGNGRTVNLSTRAFVGSGGNVLIGGFVVQGPAYKKVLIRGVGPTLGAFGVAKTLADPVLTLYSGSTVLATNDRWSAADNLPALVAASKVVGAFDLTANSEDAAMLITVPPGPYTVIVSGKADGQGVALLEIYDVP